MRSLTVSWCGPWLVLRNRGTALRVPCRFDVEGRTKTGRLVHRQFQWPHLILKLMAQRRPSRANVEATKPDTDLTLRSMILLPNPRRFGRVSTGPPSSPHSSLITPSMCLHEISTRPSRRESAPCFTAFVTSSWNTRARWRAVSGYSSTSGPPARKRLSPP